MRKTWIIGLLVALLLTALPGTVLAQPEETDRVTAVIQEARHSYVRSLSTAGKESFHGFCGLMTSHQLYNLGINDWCIINDGNRQYDYYRDLEVTSGGYCINAYDSLDFSLEEALNAITRYGTRDAHNILVGFQWTSTEAGAIYGHAVLINAILDGTVYFVESFDCNLGGPEGSVITCSIKEFADYFSTWTDFEGVIHFGTYSEVCASVGTDLFLRTRFESVLRSEPVVVGEKGCTRLRTVAAGEMLRATAIYTNSMDEMYYRVEDGQRVGFIAASAVSVIRVNAEDLSFADPGIPEVIAVGEDRDITGTVSAANGGVGAVEVTVTDSMGKLVLREQVQTQGVRCDIACLNEQLCFDLLEQGVYLVEVYGECACPAVTGGVPEVRYERIHLWGQVLQVGGTLQNAKAQPVMGKFVTQQPEGWVWQDGTWYCYQDGKACTGWVSHCGVDYYLDDSGAVTTGWADIDGRRLYFSATGALCTGWLDTDEGMTYRGRDGGAVTGWQTIDEKLYCFDEDGILITDAEMTRDGTIYILESDGRALPKPQQETE